MKYCRCGNSMPQARINLGYNSFQRQRKFFSKSKMVIKYQKLFNKVARNFD